MGFVLTNQAKDDLKAIGRYTNEKWGREQRNRYLALLDESFQNLASGLLFGHDCAAIRSGYRKLKVGSHVVFYRAIGEDGIEIVRILHRRMDVDAQFGESHSD